MYHQRILLAAAIAAQTAWASFSMGPGAGLSIFAAQVAAAYIGALAYEEYKREQQ